MKKIGFWEAYSIGVGGMIGGGIFAVLGLTIMLAKGGAPLAFLFAGLIALITSYSYVKLSLRYPSEGGTVEFLVRAFGNTVFVGYLNILLLASYIIMLSLYSYAFGSYASVLILGYENHLLEKFLTAGVIFFFTFLNILGAYISGKAEDLMVFAKLGILIFFSILGFWTADWTKLSPENWESILGILTGGLMIFLAYEGFELIANTAQDIKDPEKNLPKAYYFAVITVILVYVIVAVVAVGNLDIKDIQKYSDYALAVAAEPFLGKFGFVLISIAAVLSTASAINATIYGSSRVSYLVAKFGELPKGLTKKIWKNATEGLIIISIITVIFATTFKLESISTAGSLGFLIIFAFVNLANLKLYKQTDTNPLIALVGFLLCLLSIFVLIFHSLKENPTNLISFVIILVGAILFETVYRILSSRKISNFIDYRLKLFEEFLEKKSNIVPSIAKSLEEKYKAKVKVEKMENYNLEFSVDTDKEEKLKEDEKYIRQKYNIPDIVNIKLTKNIKR